jgi:hypothetical protein
MGQAKHGNEWGKQQDLSGQVGFQHECQDDCKGCRTDE